MSHYDDEAQVEALHKWWQENWKALVSGLAIGLAGIVGWQSWQQHRDRVGVEAARLYSDLTAALIADKADDVKSVAGKLVQDYPDTPYASQAQLLVAAYRVEKSDLDGARDSLQWVVAHSDDDGLQNLARLREAQVLWQQGKLDQALALLDVEDPGPFAALYADLRGDIQLARGDRAAARAAYERALALNPAETVRENLERKLNDLADAAKAAS